MLRTAIISMSGLVLLVAATAATGEPDSSPPPLAGTSSNVGDQVDTLDYFLTAISKETKLEMLVFNYSRAAVLFSRRAALHDAYMRALLRLGQVEMAYHPAYLLGKQDPQNGLAWALRAHMYARRGEYERAFPAAVRAATLEPSHLLVLDVMGQLAAWLDHYGEAAEADDSARVSLASMREDLNKQEAFTQAYAQAKDFLAAQAKIDADAEPPVVTTAPSVGTVSPVKPIEPTPYPPTSVERVYVVRDYYVDYPYGYSFYGGIYYPYHVPWPHLIVGRRRGWGRRGLLGDHSRRRGRKDIHGRRRDRERAAEAVLAERSRPLARAGSVSGAPAAAAAAVSLRRTSGRSILQAPLRTSRPNLRANGRNQRGRLMLRAPRTNSRSNLRTGNRSQRNRSVLRAPLRTSRPDLRNGRGAAGQSLTVGSHLGATALRRVGRAPVPGRSLRRAVGQGPSRTGSRLSTRGGARSGGRRR